MPKRLASGEGLAAVEAALLLMASRVAFILPMPLLLSRWLKTSLRSSSAFNGDVRAARRVGRVVAAVSRRRPFKATCLQRSLVLVSVLRRRGLGARLRIGVRRSDEGGVTAHAWVEVSGVAVNDSPHNCSRFAVLEGEDQGVRVLSRRTA